MCRMPKLWKVKRKSFHHGRVLKDQRILVIEIVFKNIWSLPWDYFK